MLVEDSGLQPGPVRSVLVPVATLGDYRGGKGEVIFWSLSDCYCPRGRDRQHRDASQLPVPAPTAAGDHVTAQSRAPHTAPLTCSGGLGNVGGAGGLLERALSKSQELDSGLALCGNCSNQNKAAW